MEVMLWFHEHFQHFSSLMQEKESDNEDDGENEDETEFHVLQPNLKEEPPASVDELSVLKEEEHASFKVERRKLIDYSGRFNPLKEEVTVKREIDEGSTWFKSILKRIPHAAPRKERVIFPEETHTDSKPPRFDLSNTLELEESYSGLFLEENVIHTFTKDYF